MACRRVIEEKENSKSLSTPTKVGAISKGWLESQVIIVKLPKTPLKTSQNGIVKIDVIQEY